MSYKCEFILFETLTWGETEEEGGRGRGSGPPLENHKLSFVS